MFEKTYNTQDINFFTVAMTECGWTVSELCDKCSLYDTANLDSNFHENFMYSRYQKRIAMDMHCFLGMNSFFPDLDKIPLFFMKTFTLKAFLLKLPLLYYIVQKTKKLLYEKDEDQGREKERLVGFKSPTFKISVFF